jgi:hypothetical protein
MTLWQELQETVPVEDSRGSMNNILPSLTLAGVVGLSAGSGALLGRVSHEPASAMLADVVNAIAARILVRFTFYPPLHFLVSAIPASNCC